MSSRPHIGRRLSSEHILNVDVQARGQPQNDGGNRANSLLVGALVALGLAVPAPVFLDSSPDSGTALWTPNELPREDLEVPVSGAGARAPSGSATPLATLAALSIVSGRRSLTVLSTVIPSACGPRSLSAMAPAVVTVLDPAREAQPNVAFPNTAK
jgi:hypothetical protein